MSEESSSVPASPVSSASTPPSSVPSPQLESLTLRDTIVSDEDKLEAAKLKAQANKAFIGMHYCSEPFGLVRTLRLTFTVRFISTSSLAN